MEFDAVLKIPFKNSCCRHPDTHHLQQRLLVTQLAPSAISSKFVDNFLSSPADRQRDKYIETIKSLVVGCKK